MFFRLATVCSVFLADANCTPCFNRSTKVFSLKKTVYFAILKILFSAPSRKMHFSSSLSIFLLFPGMSLNFVQSESEGLPVILPERNIWLANLKNTNFWSFWKTINNGRCSHNLYMST